MKLVQFLYFPRNYVAPTAGLLSASVTCRPALLQNLTVEVTSEIGTEATRWVKMDTSRLLTIPATHGRPTRSLPLSEKIFMRSGEQKTTEMNGRKTEERAPSARTFTDDGYRTRKGDACRVRALRL
jgi:hypothetical protein